LTLPEISRDQRHDRDSKPAFQEQWHAQVIAVVELLVSSGRLASGDWAATLGSELDKRSRAGEPDNDASCYAAFLAALEFVLHRNGIALSSEVDRRENDWRRAYLNTPHGKPVVLADYTWLP
jgi:hypothetical protein